MEVTMNGPILVEADPVIETSMNRYWNSKRWHFTKKWDIRDHLNNKESLAQCVSGGQKFREVILRKCSDSVEYTPKLVNICSDSMKNTPPYSKVILRKCSDSAEYTPKLVNYL